MSLYNFATYLYEHDNKKYLLYSCIQKSTSSKVKDLKKVTTQEFASLGKVHVLKARIDLKDWNVIESFIDKNELKGIYFDDIEISIIDKRSFYQVSQDSSDNFSRFNKNSPESLSSYTEKVKVYYTEHQSLLLNYLESLSYTQSIVFKNEILDFLEKNIGLRFTSSYSYRIGCFEEHNIQSKSFPELLSNNSGFTINNLIEKDNIFMIHVVLRDTEEIIYDKLLSISEKSSSYAIENNFNTAEVTVFNEKGDLLHKECNHYVESIHMGISMMSGVAYNIGDKLTKKLTGKSKEKAANIVSNTNKTTSIISTDKTAYKKNKHRVNNIFFNIEPQYKGGFFLKYEHTDEKGKAFEWLIDLINNAQYVTIIDPYFSSKVVTESLRRVNREISVHVLTSLSTANKFSEIDTIDGCKNTLMESANEIACSLKIENYTKSNGEKLFHDRFVITQNENRKTVYMLSNSLSGYCESFPFTYMPLDAYTAEKVLSYFENLDWDINREVLWDTSLFPEKTNILISYAEKERILLTSTWFLEGLKHIVDNDIENVTLDSKGLIEEKNNHLEVNDEIFSELIENNIFSTTKIFSKQEIVYILIVCGELCARSHADDIIESIIEWLNVQKSNIDIQEVFDEICQLSTTIIDEKNYSEDVSFPEIKTTRKLFEYSENAILYGFRDIKKNWGLYFSSYFLIHVQSLDITRDDLSSEVLNNILAGLFNDIVPGYKSFNQEFAVNLIESNTTVLKVFGVSYITTSLDDFNNIVMLLKKHHISNELIILSLARRYKEYMHRYYRAEGNDERITEILYQLDDIAKNACAVWDTIELEENKIEEIYACFFNKYEFIYRFGMFLSNVDEKKKLYIMILNNINSYYGWKTLDKVNCSYNAHDIENIKWAGQAYLDVYDGNLMKGLYKWDSKFIVPAKQKLEEPLYRGKTTQLADRLAALLFFVSEFLVKYTQKGNELSEVTNIIKSLYEHTYDLFESGKCQIYAINEEMYFNLLYNLSELLIIHNDTSINIAKEGEYPLLNYLLVASNDYKNVENYGAMKLQEIAQKTTEPSYYSIRLIMLICLNAYVNKKEIPLDILEAYTEIMEENGILDAKVLNFPTDMTKLLSGKINELSINVKKRILSLKINP